MSEVNHKPVDRFTAAHAAAGLLLGLSGRVSFSSALLLAVGWELIENPLKERWPHLFPHPSFDSFQNSALDAVSVMAGWTFARYVLTPEEERRRDALAGTARVRTVQA